MKGRRSEIGKKRAASIRQMATRMLLSCHLLAASLPAEQVALSPIRSLEITPHPTTHRIYGDHAC
jgi:hypothetical protein